MSEFMYGINSGVLALVLFLAMLLVKELGYRVGRKSREGTTEASRDHVNSIQASILGILALLLGFTLSLSLQRYDHRSEAVVDEANAIGTAMLRVQLLPEPNRAQAATDLREYLELRVQSSSSVRISDHDHLDLLAETRRVQARLWDNAARASLADPSPARSNLYLQAVNELVDSYGRREDALRRHVPETVLLLLFTTFLMAGGIIGFASGVNAHRPSTASYVMVMLIVVLVFLIVDLDRPRRGFVQVSQQSLIDLQAAQTQAKH